MYGVRALIYLVVRPTTRQLYRVRCAVRTYRVQWRSSSLHPEAHSRSGGRLGDSPTRAESALPPVQHALGSRYTSNTSTSLQYFTPDGWIIGDAKCDRLRWLSRQHTEDIKYHVYVEAWRVAQHRTARRDQYSVPPGRVPSRRWPYSVLDSISRIIVGVRQYSIFGQLASGLKGAAELFDKGLFAQLIRAMEQQVKQRSHESSLFCRL